MNQKYIRDVRELSDTMITLQQPIRVLDAVQWDDGIREAFFESQGRELPRVDDSYYRDRRPLRFDPEAKTGELYEFKSSVETRLGRTDPVGALLLRMTGEYLEIVEMLKARGTMEFSSRSNLLYGHASARETDAGPCLDELAHQLVETLDRIGATDDKDPETTYSGTDAVAILQERLDRVFDSPEARVRVSASDGIAADAAAGADKIKLRADARFTDRELRLLEVHEGWVHIGTTLNGSQQRTCTFLSKGTPASTITQEGLAVFMEVAAMVSYPERVRKIANRVRAISLAEGGADFIEVVRFFQDEGKSLRDGYAHAERVFRGSLPNGGPFTKDLSYLRGFVRVQAALADAVRKGQVERLPLLFCGKVATEDLASIHTLIETGLVERPRYLPPQFTDPHALTAWLCFANYVSLVPMESLIDAPPSAGI